MDLPKNEYVYMIREREFLLKPEHTYKIGRTKQEPNTRLEGYPKHSEVILFVKVNDCADVEAKIKKRFTKAFTHKKEYGAEYFYGDFNKMLTEFLNIVNDKNCKFRLNELEEIIESIKIDYDKKFRTMKENYEIKISDLEKLHKNSPPNVDQTNAYIRELELKLARMEGKLEGYVEGVIKSKK